jgi:hypothetical protein
MSSVRLRPSPGVRKSSPCVSARPLARLLGCLLRGTTRPRLSLGLHLWRQPRQPTQRRRDKHAPPLCQSGARKRALLPIHCGSCVLPLLPMELHSFHNSKCFGETCPASPRTVHLKNMGDRGSASCGSPRRRAALRSPSWPLDLDAAPQERTTCKNFGTSFLCNREALA